MTAPLLVVFDVDGTLVDGQGLAVEALRSGFSGLPGTPPTAAAVRGVLGHSLGEAVTILRPTARPSEVAQVVESYRATLQRAHACGDAARQPLYPGIADLLAGLSARPAVLLGLATGKSRRGVAAVLDAHGLGGRFLTVQTADDHPAKPHPSMLTAALAETGTPAARCVMVGASVSDMAMAAAAGVAGVGAAWGASDAADLMAAGAVGIAATCDEVPAWIDRLVEQRA